MAERCSWWQQGVLCSTPPHHPGRQQRGRQLAETVRRQRGAARRIQLSVIICPAMILYPELQFTEICLLVAACGPKRGLMGRIHVDMSGTYMCAAVGMAQCPLSSRHGPRDIDERHLMGTVAGRMAALQAQDHSARSRLPPTLA